MKILRNILILSIIILIIYVILNNLGILKLQKIASVKEGFTNGPNIWPSIEKYYGNIIYNNNNPENTTEDLEVKYNSLSVRLRLPGEKKITGFKVNLDEIDETNMKYSIAIGNDINSMIKIQNEYGFDKFNFGEDIKDILLFENEDGTSKYNGKLAIIKLENTEGNIDKSKTYILKAMIMGLDVFAMNSKTYGNFKLLFNKQITTNTGPNSSISLGDENKKVVALKLDTTSNIITKISYDNTYDGNKRRYIAVGPIKQGFDMSNEDSNIIYFTKPIIAQNIYFKDISGSSNVSITGNVDIYGSNPSKRDEINFKFEKQLEDNNSLGIAIQGEKCPSVNQIMRRQLQTQQLCEALEYKDRIRNEKVVYEKEKSYLKKLASQEKDLQELEKLINGLIERKNDRIKSNKHHSVEALDRELKKIEKVRKQAEEDLQTTKKAHDLKVSLNLEPQFNDILAKYNLDNVDG